MRIGQLARAAGVGVETVRYYQRQALLRTPEKPYGGTRSYDESDLGRLRFILRAKDLGFSLKDIGRLLALSQRDCDDVQAIAHEKLAMVRAKLESLRRMEQALVGTLEKCQSRSPHSGCPIIETLSDPSP